VVWEAKDQIYLVGFMGAGKTTVGQNLGALLGWDFADLDEAICRREGMSITEIFRERGEPFFRQREQAVLASLAGRQRLVVATGGGTYVSEENRNLVEAAGWSVWLQVSLPEALRRCGGGVERPLLGSQAEIEALFRHRREFYRCARMVSDTERIPPAQVAKRVLDDLLAAGFRPR